MLRFHIYILDQRGNVKGQMDFRAKDDEAAVRVADSMNIVIWTTAIAFGRETDASKLLRHHPASLRELMWRFRRSIGERGTHAS